MFSVAPSPKPLPRKKKRAMQTYLSVDLDYWNEAEPMVVDNDLDVLIDQICAREIPFRVVFDHEKLLYHLRKFEFQRLVNVDAHSDISNIDTAEGVELNCGTWVNFVPFCRNREYLWVHPGSTMGGRCDNKEHIYFQDLDTGWPDIEETNMDWERVFDWEDVVAVGIALSPDFTEPDVLADFLMKLHGYGRCKYMVVDSP